MFFIKDISIEDKMKDYNLSFIPSYRYSRKYSDSDRGEIALRYPWNGIVIADIPNLPNPSELKWDLGVFNGQACDVGGGGHKYLLDYQKELKIKYIDHVSIQRDADSGDKHTPPDGYIAVSYTHLTLPTKA